MQSKVSQSQEMCGTRTLDLWIMRQPLIPLSYQPGTTVCFFLRFHPLEVGLESKDLSSPVWNSYPGLVDHETASHPTELSARYNSLLFLDLSSSGS